MATAAIMMAGCASDDLVGDENISSGETPFAFSMNTPNATRGASEETGKDAAKTLDYEFIVWGEKNEEDKKATSVANLVFENYRVQYANTEGNTANTTVSNTNGWEYVGLAPYNYQGTAPTSGTTGNESNATVSPSIYNSTTNSKQTIKYWDFKATNGYVFTAVSALKSDIMDGKVTITKTQGAENLESSKKGYTIVLTNGAKAENIFVADRNPVSTPTAAANVAPVKMQFRNFQTKIRFGFYETVPGYNVEITGVKYTYDSNETATSTALGVHGDFVEAPTGTDKVTYEVTYDSGNKPVVTVTRNGTSATGTSKTFGSYIFGKNIGKASNAATYDKVSNPTTSTDGEYTCILPNTGNTTEMSFIVSYKLISEDTKEEIAITDRKVTVPAAYCQWKPNFAYTYLFKVSDASAELYPITFDAVVEADEVSKQETITEVSGTTEKVSITTFATSSDGKTVITGKNEYGNGDIIYASVMEDATAVSSLSDTNIKLYTVTTTASDNSTITEAAVANCLKNAKSTTSSSTPAVTTWSLTDLNNVTLTVTAVTSDLTYPTTVPAEDGGKARSLSALQWTAGASGTIYAVEYTKTTTTGGEGSSTTTTTKYYKIVKVVASGN